MINVNNYSILENKLGHLHISNPRFQVQDTCNYNDTLFVSATVESIIGKGEMLGC